MLTNSRQFASWELPAGLTSFGSIEAKCAKLKGEVTDTVRFSERSYAVSHSHSMHY